MRNHPLNFRTGRRSRIAERCQRLAGGRSEAQTSGQPANGLHPGGVLELIRSLFSPSMPLAPLRGAGWSRAWSGGIVATLLNPRLISGIAPRCRIAERCQKLAKGPSAAETSGRVGKRIALRRGARTPKPQTKPVFTFQASGTPPGCGASARLVRGYRRCAPQPPAKLWNRSAIQPHPPRFERTLFPGIAERCQRLAGGRSAAQTSGQTGNRLHPGGVPEPRFEIWAPPI